MGSFLLSPGRNLPSRFRVQETWQNRTGSTAYRSGTDPNVHVVADANSICSGKRETIWDEKGDGWHDVIHEKLELSDGPTFDLPSGPYIYCNANSWHEVEDGTPAGNFSADGNLSGEYLSWGEVLDRSEIQDAIGEIALEWERKLYSFRPDNLPDMAVFVKELHELSSIFGVLWDTSQVLIGLAKKRSKLVRLLDREVKILRGMETVTNRRKLQRQRDKIKSIRSAIKELANVRLGYNFGVRTALSDLTKIIAAFYDYMQQMTFEPTHEKIRRRGTFQVEKAIAMRQGCWGLQCYDQSASSVYATIDVEYSLCANVVFKNRLKGSATERAIYTVLSQLGLMPNVTSIWDMTKFTWLINYFIRTDHLLAGITPTLGLGLQDPLIYRSCLSLKLSQKLTGYLKDDCPRYMYHRPTVEETYSHYERIAGKDPRSLSGLVHLLRAPSLNQSLNATALLLQSLL